MPKVAVASPDMPLAQRVTHGLGYPLRGAALATCVALALCNGVAWIPGPVGVGGIVLVWAAMLRYGAECLVSTARGFDDPPEIGLNEARAAGGGLIGIYLAVVAVMLLAWFLAPRLLWLLLPLVILALPAATMAMAFDGSVALALNPLHAGRIARRFGAGYLAPVAINTAVLVLVALAIRGASTLPALLALPLLGFACSYLVILGFHLMGALIHTRHADFGIALVAEQLAHAGAQDADAELLAQAQRLTPADPRAATDLLVARLQDRSAPASLHRAYRELLKRQHLHDALLVHGQIWIAAMMAGGEARRALGLVQECSSLDPAFIPDDPRNAGELALLASRMGMPQMALKLSRGYLRHWPRDWNVPSMSLLAAEVLAAIGQAAEAAVLLHRLAREWPEHPLQHELQAQAAALQPRRQLP